MSFEPKLADWFLLKHDTLEAESHVLLKMSKIKPKRIHHIKNRKSQMRTRRSTTLTPRGHKCWNHILKILKQLFLKCSKQK